MSDFYADFVNDAQELIAEFGRDVTLQKTTAGAYDRTLGRKADGVTISRTVKAVFTDYQEKDIDGDVIRRGDKRCLIAGAVEGNEVVLDGGDQYAIVNIESVQPGDTLILSKVQVRR